MGRPGGLRGPLFLSLLLIVIAGSAAAGSADLKDLLSAGRVRVELTGAASIHAGRTDRHGDGVFTGSIEYEVPVLERLSLGAKLIPVLIYREHRNDDDRTSSKTVYGGGAGLAGRVYRVKNAWNGWFAEASGSVLWHSRYIEDNTSRVNFFLEGGIGYKFRENNWHVAVKFQHLSNGGITSHNAGFNGVAMAVGYTF